MIFRLSQKLAKKLKEEELPSLPLDENPYADWSAHLFTADRTQYIIVTNTISLYSVVMYGKGITDGGLFIDRALGSLRDFMKYDQLAFLFERFIAPESEKVRFSKALNRSVAGSMNDMIRHAKFWLIEWELFPLELAIKLTQIPMGSLGYQYTREVFKSLAGGVGLSKGGEEHDTSP